MPFLIRSGVRGPRRVTAASELVGVRRPAASGAGGDFMNCSERRWRAALA
jgi:hypothetical protein